MAESLKTRLKFRVYDYQPLSPIPEVANSACISPEIPLDYLKNPASKSAKVLSPKAGINKGKGKKTELRLRNKFIGGLGLEKKHEFFHAREEKIKEIKEIKLSKTPKRFLNEKFLPESLSPNRYLKSSKSIKQQKSGSVPKFSHRIWRDKKERFGLLNLKEAQPTNQHLEISHNFDYQGRKPNKALITKVIKTNHFEIDCKEIQEIVKKFASKLKKRNIQAN